ncbi:MAG TPA: c-type cytochrome biogenesis protein CcsB [Dehalococcoidia bacterium]|nr:c-type cytochrome biogenesis protein CcsB [Dehalococcoidia bacterium]
MEKLSITGFWLALAATAAAVIFYWGYVFGARVALRRLATSPGGGITTATFERLPVSLARLGGLAAWNAVFFIVLSLFARWRATGYAPWSNMWEFTVAFAGGVILFNIIFEREYGQKALGAFIQPVALAMLAAAAAFFPSEVKPLVPALQSRGILAAHVGIMVLSYAALSVSFGAALMYILQGGSRNRFSRLPRASLLDEIAYKSVIVGFPLLAVGIALGAYWGNSAWGRYWGWDPKETSALVTWLIYGVYLHMRALRSWSGMRSAVMLVVGYGAVLFTYFAVNLWVSGLHSYAGV